LTGQTLRKPPWLTKRLPDAQALERMRRLLKDLRLHTICESASCPNLGECWAQSTATFLILGNACTRRCGFCNVTPGRPAPVDPEEPAHVAEAVQALGLQHVVITSVTRDDLADGGAAHFAATVRAIRAHNPATTVELLIPDLAGSSAALAEVLAAAPTVLAHNLETVRSLHACIRPRFSYDRSLAVLATTRRLAPAIYTKSSLMVGLGESPEDVLASLADLRGVDCDFVTIGQYLRPSARHAPVVEYVRPEVFAYYREKALELGFKHVASGPFVRSSFAAAAALRAAGLRRAGPAAAGSA
jgi:lipoic acid synthetase